MSAPAVCVVDVCDVCEAAAALAVVVRSPLGAVLLRGGACQDHAAQVQRAAVAMSAVLA